MNILIAGGTGFIGSHLAIELAQKGHDVTVLDNYLLGSDENISSVERKIKAVKGDIRDYELLKKISEGKEIIFNEAAASSSPMFMNDLSKAVSINIDGFVNILNAARENDVKKIIYASTSSIYGNSHPPLKEDMKTEPVNFYASTKLMNEHLAAIYSKEYGIQTIGFRYMSVYGPHEKSKGRYANLVSQFLWAMQKNERPVIYGSGEQTRDFVYVKDIVHANILAMEAKKKLFGEVFNAGTGKCVSLNGLISTINKILGKSIEPEYVEIPVKNYIMTQLADISKIRDALGFEPRYGLEEGIRDIISS